MTITSRVPGYVPHIPQKVAVSLVGPLTQIIITSNPSAETGLGSRYPDKQVSIWSILLIPNTLVQNRHMTLCQFCTNYVPFDFRHKIGIPILYLTENIDFSMCHCLLCAFVDLVIFSCAYFVPLWTLSFFLVPNLHLKRT